MVNNDWRNLPRTQGWRVVGFDTDDFIYACVYYMSRKLYNPVLRHMHALLHDLQVLGDLELGIGLGLNILDAQTGRDIRHSKATVNSVDLENGHLGDDGTRDPRTGQRQVALLDDLRTAVLGAVVSEDDNLGLVRVRDQIHSAAHTLEHAARDEVVGQVAVGADLQGTQHGDVDVAAADHAERLGAVEGAAAGHDGDGLFAGVDDVGVDFFFGWVWTHAEQTVLAVDPDLGRGVQVGWREGRHAYAEVDVHAVLELLGGASGDALAAGLRRRLLLGLAARWSQFLDLEFLGLGGLDDAVDVDTWQVDLVGLEGADGDDLVGLDDGQLGGFGHHWAEVAGGVAEDAVAGLVDLFGAQHGDVGFDGVFHVEFAAAELAGLALVAGCLYGWLAAFLGWWAISDRDLTSLDPGVCDRMSVLWVLGSRDIRTDTGRSVESRNTSTTSSDPLGDGSLWGQFDGKFAAQVLLLDDLVLTEEGQDE